MSKPSLLGTDEHAAAPPRESTAALEVRPTLDEVLERLDDAADHPFAHTLARFEEEDRREQQRDDLLSWLDGSGASAGAALLIAFGSALVLVAIWVIAQLVR